MNMNRPYDIIIIGSGIAGLYSAYQIKKYNPNIKFLILEKYKKTITVSKNKELFPTFQFQSFTEKNLSPVEFKIFKTIKNG